MSADDLIAASTRIRHDVDFQQAYGDDTFLLAVADWLDGMALSMTHPSGGPSTDREEDAAFLVARAYLGESA